jgi:ERCC4-type nuclease
VHSARALLEHFGSVRNVVDADPSNWLSVPGIGRARARSMAQTFLHCSTLSPPRSEARRAAPAT